MPPMHKTAMDCRKNPIRSNFPMKNIYEEYHARNYVNDT